MRPAIWRWLGGGFGLEAVEFAPRDGGITASGKVVRESEDQKTALTLTYEIAIAADWSVNRVRIDCDDGTRRALRLAHDGNGQWRSGKGAALEPLAGCIDVDIAASPFTNTLPIRRLSLAPKGSASIRVVYIDVPSLELTPVVQRYTCLAKNADGSGRYRYESVSSGFKAELDVDGDGLVIDYPNFFVRLAAPES